MIPLRPPPTDELADRLAPQELAGTVFGVLFAGICMVTLVLIFLGDVLSSPPGQLAIVALVPVAAAAWLLSARGAYLVAGLAMFLVAAATVATAAMASLAVINVVMIGLVALIGRIASTGVVRGREMRRREQQARTDLARAERLEREKSEFLRLASHELRGPVSILRGYIAMLEDGSLGALAAPVAEVVPILSATASGMNATVDQMLDAARLEDDRLQLRMARNDLAWLVRDAVRTVALMHDARDRVHVSGADRPLLIDIDAGRVRTIVGNLVSNALKYSPSDSDVRVSVETDTGTALVHVVDDGIGIADDQRSRLFTRFGRIENPRSVGVPGTGLGLYLSRELARRHGGDITVESSSGSGSTFTLRLPVRPRSVEDAIDRVWEHQAKQTQPVS